MCLQVSDLRQPLLEEKYLSLIPTPLISHRAGVSQLGGKTSVKPRHFRGKKKAKYVTVPSHILLTITVTNGRLARKRRQEILNKKRQRPLKRGNDNYMNCYFKTQTDQSI